MPVEMPNTANPRQDEDYFAAGKRGRAILWQVIDFSGQPMFPHLLAMHVNPNTLNEEYSKSKVITPTYGGFIEFVWPDELDSISADASTGAFYNPNVGLTAGSDIEINVIPGQVGNPYVGKVGRQSSMAWERQEDLLDVFHNNGSVYDGRGIPRLKGSIRCIFDRGIYTGRFESFNVKETDSKAFTFDIQFSFKIDKTEYIFPESVDFSRRT